MKIPAACIVTAFAIGILLARSDAPLTAPTGNRVLLALIVLATFSIASGFLLLQKRHVALAALCAAVAWVFLGSAAMRLTLQPLQSNHVAVLLGADPVHAPAMDTGTALRWRARLRDDPRRTPQGLQVDLDLESVELDDAIVPVQGGMRLSYFRNERESDPVAVRAGDRIEVLAQAKLPRNYKDPGAFDRRGYLASQNIHVLANLRHSELLALVDTPPLTLSHRIARMRGRLMEHVDSFFAPEDPRAAILRAMLLGDRHFVDHQAAESFQKSGAYHVLVIAGLHVAALVVFVLWACKRLRVPQLGATLITLAVLALYLAMVEDRPPILRAALMAAIFLFARLLFRRVDLLNTAALAALLLLIARPAMLFDSSFQLSFLAIASIGAMAIPFMARSSEPYRRALANLHDTTIDANHQPRVAQFRLDLRALSRAIRARLPASLKNSADWLITSSLRIAFAVWHLVVLSLALQIGMLPLMARDFHRISMIGPLANIVAVPLTGIIVPAGFVALTVSFFWHALGHALVQFAGALVTILSTAINWCAQLPRTSYRVPGPPLWLVAGFFAVFVTLALALRAKGSRWLVPAAMALLAFASIIAIYPFPPRLQSGRLEIAVLDVGQGDSLFVAFPGGHTMLVDGGGIAAMGRPGAPPATFDVGDEVVSPYLWSRGLKHLDVVALTHAHQDHLGGLSAVLENFRVGALWISRDSASPALKSLEAVARRRAIPVIHEHEGEEFGWDGVHGQVLWPPPSDSALPTTGKNDDSLVLRLQFAGDTFLLAGDIERQAEYALSLRGESLHSDFLKIAHHGSKTSSTEPFLQTISPRVGVISVGEGNPYGHPHPDALARLQASGVRILRTDRDGAVTLVSDGKSQQITCYVPCPMDALAGSQSVAPNRDRSAAPSHQHD